ncbi:hypothetical protein M8007_21975 (plasmid) [Dinoroseobacter shibae]|uniref:hypothetical protein n=1 Tax=Dinoroseobacter shibae TaxID=215813 RepID=UPI002020820A|nr:hypothetical protein [Dinoroseobacter shibae]URF49229.1 hypothetical protein M8008_21955 [Dinoroseobacter shibae]URF53536.1 hypothetical protein M8007_21975 [Dinoroseobacter shibae]
MKSVALSSIVIVAMAFPALSDSEHMGQLEKTIGVEHGEFSSGELARIKGSYDSDTGFNLPAQHERDLSSQSTLSQRAKAQLAAAIGVDPRDYTFAELAAIKGSYDSENGYRIPLKNESIVSTQSNHNTAAKEQLASSLGVDATKFSLSELAAIKGSFDSDTGYNFPPSH